MRGSFRLLLSVFILIKPGDAWAVPNARHQRKKFSMPILGSAKFDEAKNYGAFVNVRKLSTEEGRTMLEWPSIEKRGNSNEKHDEGETIYCLEGCAECKVSTYLNGVVEESFTLYPGDLMSVEQSCAVQWIVPAGKSVVLLTPSYNEVPLFLGVLAGVIALFGLLIAAALDGSG